MNAPALSIYVVSLVCVWAILYIRWRLGLFTARLLVGRVRLCRVRENGDPKGIDSSGLGLKRRRGMCNTHLFFFHFQDVSR
jgi:hypothetical protein